MTDRKQFEVWFNKRWPEFTNSTESAYEAWCAGAAAEREGYDAACALLAQSNAERDALRAALVECEHQTHSLRVWSGSAWSYHPPQAGRIAKIARAAIDAAMAAQTK
jgi:hypothetical protein